MPCPFWEEEGQCIMEGCSVCACEENEIPHTWLESALPSSAADFGWVTAGSSYDDSLGKVALSGVEKDAQRASQREQQALELELQRLREESDDDSDDWTVLSNMNASKKKEQVSGNGNAYMSDLMAYGALLTSNSAEAEAVESKAVYVNLLENPERFTGYAGPSAQRVWRSIQEENCFGEQSDVCLEKRIFFRLMSGLQSSISTHISKEYLHGDGTWGHNYPLFWRAVGDHPDRLNNLYFGFLFLLRSVVKAQDAILSYPYHTGNATDDQAVKKLMSVFLAASNSTGMSSDSTLSSQSSVYGWNSAAMGGTGVGPDTETVSAVEECRYGFDESEMFQVSDVLGQYWNTLEAKQDLREEFMSKFRNISRIMDCVTCEKCRVWGKLQILGLGTAVKILLTPAQPAQAGTTCASTGHLVLNRQEIIALLNTLHQFSKSLKFAALAARKAEQQGLNPATPEASTPEASEVHDTPGAEVPKYAAILALALFAAALAWVGAFVQRRRHGEKKSS
mmetsp:Transcript_29603/g.66422  ORF Transcript_29603/g.66422 Transcript_29603/m.66422 type:complete len:508 (-) Transcript_29603:90-1613(-)